MGAHDRLVVGVIPRQSIRMWIGERPSRQGLDRIAHTSGLWRPGPNRNPALRHYLRAVFRAGALRATVLRAGALRATVLRAGALRAAVFLAGAFAGAAADFPAPLTASSEVGYAPFASFGALAGASTASLKAFTGVIRAFFDALIRIASPVAGLRPMRAGRSTLTNLAKPVMATGSPFDTTAVTTSVKPSRTETTVFKSTSDWTATALASSRLFMGAIMTDAHPRMHFFLKIFSGFFAVSGHGTPARSPEVLISGANPGVARCVAAGSGSSRP